jgi:sugar/nucleoside kinase (ribokinase family)
LGLLAACVTWLARAGVHTELISRVGDDAPGRKLRATFTAAGVGTEGLQTHPDRPTGLRLARCEDGPGDTDYPGADRDVSHGELRSVERASLLLLTLDDLRDDATGAVCRDALRRARATGVPVALGVEATPNLRRRPRHETQAALGELLSEETLLWGQATALRSLFPGFFSSDACREGLVDLGARAALLCDSSGGLLALGGPALEPEEPASTNHTPEAGAALLALGLDAWRQGTAPADAARKAVQGLHALWPLRPGPSPL